MKLQNYPGPGKYEIINSFNEKFFNSKFKNPQLFIMKEGIKRFINTKSLLSIPGPGKY